MAASCSRTATRPLAAVRRRRGGRPAQAPLPDTAEDDEQQGACRRTASASPTCRTATATTATSISGSRTAPPGRAIACAAIAAGARARRRRLPVVVARRRAARILRRPRGFRCVWVVGCPTSLGAGRRTGLRMAPVRRLGRARAPADARLASWRRPGLVARRQASRDRRTCRRPTRVQRQPAAQRPTSRRRSSRRPTRSGCGSSTRRCRSTPASARLRQRRRATASCCRPSIACGRRCGGSTTRAGRPPRAGRSCRTQYRPQAQARRTKRALESAIDAMVAEQPLIKPPVVSDRAVVVSGHPLASRAGALALERGGNIVDAAIAVSFALGVVEPDASGIGGDGMAILYLKGMSEPVVIDYKDQVADPRDARQPAARGRHWRRAAAANIPGVVAGLDSSIASYASKKVPWSDLVAPAIDYAENGYVLDEALPTTIAEGRKFFEKYRRRRSIFLPGRQGAAGRRSLRQQGLRRDAARPSRRTARMRSTAARSRARLPTTWRRTAASSPSTTSRSTAPSSGGRSPAAIAIISLLGAAAGRRPAPAHRDAADPRELPAEAGRDLHERRRLSPLRDRVVEGARSGPRSPTPRCGTSASDRTSMPRTPRRSSSGSIRRRHRTAIGRRRQPMRRPSASAAGRRRSPSRMRTAT